MHACMHACMYVCMCVMYVMDWMCVCMYVCTYVCMYVLMYACVHACMHEYMHAQLREHSVWERALKQRTHGLSAWLCDYRTAVFASTDLASSGLHVCSAFRVFDLIFKTNCTTFGHVYENNAFLKYLFVLY